MFLKNKSLNRYTVICLLLYREFARTSEGSHFKAPLFLKCVRGGRRKVLRCHFVERRSSQSQSLFDVGNRQTMVPEELREEFGGSRKQFGLILKTLRTHSKKVMLWKTGEREVSPNPVRTWLRACNAGLQANVSKHTAPWRTGACGFRLVVTHLPT